MPVTVPIDKMIDQSLYAKSKTAVYSAINPKKVAYHVEPNKYIGKVYSWVQSPNGGLFYMFYKDQNAYNNFIPSYVEHDPDKINVPTLPDIVKEIEDEKEKKEKEDKGLLPYYIEKYAPWLVGGLVVAIALPSIINSAKKVTMKGIDKKSGIVILLILIAVVASAKKKEKKPNKIIIEDPKPYGEGYNAPWTPGGYQDQQIPSADGDDNWWGSGSLYIDGTRMSLNGFRLPNKKVPLTL